MNMAVDKIPGTEPLDKHDERTETAVAQVKLIVNTFRRCVGKKDVEVSAVNDPVPYKPRKQPEHVKKHAEIGILVYSVVVAHAPAEPRDKHSSQAYDFPSRVQGADTFTGIGVKICPGIHVPVSVFIEMNFRKLMVAEHKHQRFVQRGDNKTVIGKGQVPGGKYNVDIGKTLFYSITVYYGVYFIGDTEQFHVD